MSPKTEERVVLVTGGTRGIGRAVVEAFLKEGATVHFCAENPDDVKDTHEQLSTIYPDKHVRGRVVNVTEFTALTAWVDKCARHSGRIDVVVSNASAPFNWDCPEGWRLAFETDVMGTRTLINAAKPHLTRSKGNIVVIGSADVYDMGDLSVGPFHPVKAALINYAQRIAYSEEMNGIRLNICSPGPICDDDVQSDRDDKDGVMRSITNELASFQASIQTSGSVQVRKGKDMDVANAVSFLASDKASYINGSNLVVDGYHCRPWRNCSV